MDQWASPFCLGDAGEASPGNPGLEPAVDEVRVGPKGPVLVGDGVLARDAAERQLPPNFVLPARSVVRLELGAQSGTTTMPLPPFLPPEPLPFFGGLGHFAFQ